MGTAACLQFWQVEIDIFEFCFGDVHKTAKVQTKPKNVREDAFHIAQSGHLSPS